MCSRENESGGDVPMSFSPRDIVLRLNFHSLKARPDALVALESVLRAESNPAAALDRLCNTMRELATARGVTLTTIDKNLVADVVAGAFLFRQK